MMDIGVASPNAQGQAMISTVTAFTTAWAILGCGPTLAQSTNVAAATASTAGTNQALIRSASPLDRRAAALRLAHHLHDAGKQGVGADPLDAHEKAARPRSASRRSPCSQRSSRPAPLPR
jgi:hypothetical protein